MTPLHATLAVVTILGTSAALIVLAVSRRAAGTVTPRRLMLAGALMAVSATAFLTDLVAAGA
jgi:ABC-type Fe3+-siderophore transport system permease subunit